MRVVGRLAESEDPVLFATYDEADKCEFIKVNAPMGAWEAWSSDDGAGLLLQTRALREQARAALVSTALCKTSEPRSHTLTLSPPASPGGDGGAPRGDGRTCGNEGTCCVEGACGDEEACGGAKERDDPGELLPPPSPTASPPTASSLPPNLLLPYSR